MDIKKLVEIGGSEWQKGEMRRVYFNDLTELFGLKLWYYNTGNISGAQLDGQDISNSAAKQICQRLTFAKVWYDVKDSKFHGKGIEQGDLDTIVKNIKAKVNG